MKYFLYVTLKLEYHFLCYINVRMLFLMCHFQVRMLFPICYFKAGRYSPCFNFETWIIILHNINFESKLPFLKFVVLTLKLEYYFPCTVKLEWYFHFVTQSFALYSFKLEHLWGNYFRLKNPFPCLFKPKYQFLMLFQSWSTISDILHYMCVISHVLLQTRMSLCTCLSWNKGLYC